MLSKIVQINGIEAFKHLTNVFYNHEICKPTGECFLWKQGKNKKNSDINSLKLLSKICSLAHQLFLTVPSICMSKMLTFPFFDWAHFQWFDSWIIYIYFHIAIQCIRVPIWYFIHTTKSKRTCTWIFGPSFSKLNFLFIHPVPYRKSGKTEGVTRTRLYASLPCNTVHWIFSLAVNGNRIRKTKRDSMYGWHVHRS